MQDHSVPIHEKKWSFKKILNINDENDEFDFLTDQEIPLVVEQ